MFLSSGERFDQSMSVSDDEIGGLEVSGRAWISGRVDRIMGGGPLVTGGGNERTAGGAAVPRSGGRGGPEGGPRDGRGGAEDVLLLESDREAAEDVRLGGGSKGVNGFLFWLTLGGGGGGGGSPL